MRDIYYEFVDLDSDESFQLLGKSLGGVLDNKGLYFDNNIVKGELIKSSPDKGLWIRKWKFTVFQNVIMRKIPPLAKEEKKFILIYFLNPAIFLVKNKGKKVNVSGSRTNIFFTSDAVMDFSVVPRQPFYVLDITFTASWLLNQLSDADTSFKNIFDRYINKNTQAILTEPCSMEEYRTLHELEPSILAGNEDVLFIRSRIYELVLHFFKKVFSPGQVELINSAIHYEQIVQAEKLITADITKTPKIDAIAKEVNMSVSSLLRQFKLMYGKNIYAYYVEKKMEFAKKMIQENNIAVKEIAEILGYNQASPFIEAFTKHHGYSPGSLKLIIN